jgi:hypothetical protein
VTAASWIAGYDCAMLHGVRPACGHSEDLRTLLPVVITCLH